MKGLKLTARAKPYYEALQTSIGELEEDVDDLTLTLLAIELAEYMAYAHKLEGELIAANKKEYQRRKDASFDKVLKLMRELKITPAARKQVIKEVVQHAADLGGMLRYQG